MSQADADLSQNNREEVTLQKIVEQRKLKNFDAADIQTKCEICRDWLAKISELLMNIFVLGKGEERFNPSFIQTINDDIKEVIQVFEKRQEVNHSKFVEYLTTSRNKSLVALYALIKANALNTNRLSNTARTKQDVAVELAYIEECFNAISECRTNLNRAQRAINNFDSVDESTQTSARVNKSTEVQPENQLPSRSPPAQNTSQEINLNVTSNSSSPVSHYREVPHSKLRSVVIEVYKTQDAFDVAISDFNEYIEERGEEKIESIPAIPSEANPLDNSLVKKILEHFKNKGKYKDFVDWFILQNPGRREDLIA